MASVLPDDVVSGEWLAAHTAEVRIADVRWYLDGRSGREAYTAGHIPGAVWLDVDADLSDAAGPGTGRHPLPSPEPFAASMTRAGIGDRTPVVAYDDAGGSIAARLWWLLHILDHPVAVLDGGLPAWPGSLEPADPGGHGGEISAESARFRRFLPRFRAAFTPRPWPPERLATADEVASLDAAEGAVVLDARTAARYAHGDPKIDPRPGHIPGARSAPWAENLDEHSRFRTAEQLRGHYQTRGVGRDTEVVAYCGSGVTACHDLLALTRAGVPNLRLYPGSWSQWASIPTRPTETSAPGD